MLCQWLFVCLLSPTGPQPQLYPSPRDKNQQPLFLQRQDTQTPKIADSYQLNMISSLPLPLCIIIVYTVLTFFIVSFNFFSLEECDGLCTASEMRKVKWKRSTLRCLVQALPSSTSLQKLHSVLLVIHKSETKGSPRPEATYTYFRSSYLSSEPEFLMISVCEIMSHTVLNQLAMNITITMWAILFYRWGD